MLIAIIFSSQASAGCGRWVVRENTDYLADPVFDAAFKDQTNRSSENSIEITDPAKTKNESTIPNQRETENFLDISGKWQINLDKAADHLEIILIQSGDRLQGYGSLIKNSTEIPVTAIGNISEKIIYLDANMVVDGTLNKVEKKYELNLAPTQEILVGSYEYFEEKELTEEGNATATKV
ncbi:MAG: hypothetical protein MUO26_06815 [Methanotrichaceae archaeon]|nr:hypothetical protein [Methanotrichaceae archaeon]